MLRRRNVVVRAEGLSLQDVYVKVRAIYGPIIDWTNPTHVALYDSDLLLYQQFITNYQSTVSFKDWLLWYFSTGSKIYGSLGKNMHVQDSGHCHGWCPYDSDVDEVSARIKLKLSDSDPLPSRNSHIINGNHYYLKSTNRGSKWGYECTCPTCAFF